MVELRIYNVVSQVHGGDAACHATLHAALAYRAEGYMFSPAYKARRWDGYVRLYNAPAYDREFGKVWTGNLHRASMALASAGIEHRVVDMRQKPQDCPALHANLKSERDYQEGAEEAVIAATRGVVRVATGGGKNPIAARVIGRLNQPSIFIVHTLNLLRQSKAELEDALGVPIGIIQGQSRKIERFNVATVQTLDSALFSAADANVRRFCAETCRLLIVDEAHHGGSPQYSRVLGNFTEAYYRVGLTATSHRHEGVTQSVDMRVEAQFGRVIFIKDRVALTEEGYLSCVKAYFL